MIIGDVSRFATEYVVGPNPDRWLFGCFCYWIDGKRIGRFDDGCSVNVALASLKYLLEYKDGRLSNLVEMQPLELFQLINRTVFGPDPPEPPCDPDPYRFFASHLGLDVFDGWRCYIVEGNDVGVLVYTNRRRTEPCDAESISHIILEYGEFDGVIEATVQSILDNWGPYLD